MNDILVPLGEEFGINIVTGAGELSLTHCVKLLERAEASGRPVRILYISDFDPAGQSMPVAAARKIEFMIRRRAPDLDVQVRHVVLTEEQCRHYRLPRIPIKDSEKRATVFEARFGEGATELDALEALHKGELERILRKEIDRYYDHGLDDRIEAATQEMQGELDRVTTAVRRRHAKAIAALKVEHRKMLAALTAFEKKAGPVLALIEDDLKNKAPHIDDIDMPEPEGGDEDLDPLFDSSRDYVEQVDRFKEFQDKPTEAKEREVHMLVCQNPKCPRKGERFPSKRRDAQTCSQACRNAISLAKKRAEADARQAKRLEGMRARQAAYERRVTAVKERKA
jgi:hypothetical protein